MIGSEPLQRRAILYGLLARLHTYPLTEPPLAALSALRLDGATEELRSALGQVQSAAISAGAAGMDAINVEATRLFEGPGKPFAPPYASFYLHGRLMGPAAISAGRFYIAQGAMPDTKLPPDLLSLELAFMAHLATRAEQTAVEGEQDAALGALAASLEFLDAHLLVWLPRFVEDVARAANVEFFPRLGRFTLAILEWDRRWLKALLSEQMVIEGVQK